MKRTTAAAVTTVTALVLAGGGAGVAVAFDHPAPHPHTPAVQTHTTAPATLTAHHPTEPASGTQRHQVTVHPGTPPSRQTDTHHSDHAVTSYRWTTPTRIPTAGPTHDPDWAQHGSWGDCDHHNR